MDTQRWQRVAAVFDEVVEALPQARAQLVERLCAGDAAVRREVEALLAADVAAAEFDRRVDSARSLAAAAWLQDDDAQSVQTGERIGPWQVLRELGRGGMGVVWLVERADGQFEQRAALKLIKRGMDSEAVIARFLRERQILARLEHPHIARLLDGGIAADGRPYFAMEYVDGQPLLRYCSEQSVKLEDRIKLFLDICTAVQFAHGQLVVHRDIKPSNILVTTAGQAKLLDFGIAILLDDSFGGPALTVDAQQRPLTPAYAAPEQLRGEPVTIATDIYALGGVLYELLTGRRPLGLGDAASPEEAIRSLETTNPLAPSKAEICDAGVPAKLLRGDLDTIILTALQRRPQMRYGTVAAFADDLRRYLSGRPIVARREHTWYRARKFVGRHRIGVAAAVVGAMLLLASLGVALWQAREKAREAHASQEVTQFLVGLFSGADPTHAKGATVTAQDLLDQGAVRLRADLGTEPVLRARLLHTVATTYVALGLYDRALPIEQDALKLRRANLSPRDPEIADSMDELGQIRLLKADYAGAEPLLRDALALRRAELARDDPALVQSLGNLGLLLQDRGDFAAAASPLLEAVQTSERHYGKDSTETAHRLDDYANNLDNLGKRVEAAALLRRALDIREKKLAPDDAEVATALQNLGVHLDEDGDHEEGRVLLERALAIRLKVFGPDHPMVGFARLALAGAYESLDRATDCERETEQALGIFRRTLPETHPKISEALNMLAISRTVRRDFTGAVPLFRDVLARFQNSEGAAHPDTLTAKNNLAATLLHAGQFAEAEQLQRDLLAQAMLDDGQGALAMSFENLASTLQQEGQFAEAVTYSQRALAMQKKREGEVSGNVAIALRGVAISEELAGDPVAAERDFRAALKMGEQLAATHAYGLYQWQIPLEDFLVGAQRCSEAEPLLKATLDAVQANRGLGGEILIPTLQLLLGECIGTGKRHVEAVAMRGAARAKLLALPGIEVDVFPTTGKLLRTK
jgi:eukaryotic-like serine/threonine-protein kinase